WSKSPLAGRGPVFNSHDLFGKPVSTFPDHALYSGRGPRGGTGRRASLKIRLPQGSARSSRAGGTNSFKQSGRARFLLHADRFAVGVRKRLIEQRAVVRRRAHALIGAEIPARHTDAESAPLVARDCRAQHFAQAFENVGKAAAR